MIFLMESFDKYPTGNTFTVNRVTITNNNASISSTAPRTGVRCIETRQHDMYIDWPVAGLSEFIYGSGIRMNVIGAGNHISFREIASGANHVILATDATGHLIAKHGGTGAQYGVTSPQAFAAAAWYWIEVRLKIHDTLGTIEVRVNGDVWIGATPAGAGGPLTGLDTRNAGLGVCDRFYYTSAFFNNGLNIDDVVGIDPNVAPAPTSFIGDSRIECISPNGNGASSQWVGNDGNSVDNYLLVDEVPHNSDTDYVQSNVVGDKDTYAYGNLSLTSGTIHGVKTTTVARKNSAGTRKMKAVGRVSGTEEDSAEFNLADSYVYFEDIKHTKPGGGSWAIADVNGAEFGVKVTA